MHQTLSALPHAPSAPSMCGNHEVQVSPGALSPLAHQSCLAFCAEDFLMLLCKTLLGTRLKLTCKCQGIYALWINVLFFCPSHGQF